MKKIKLGEIEKRLIKTMPGLSEAINQAIHENIGEDFHFALLVYSDKTRTLSGSQDADKTMNELKRLIDHHENNDKTECQIVRGNDTEH